MVLSQSGFNEKSMKSGLGQPEPRQRLLGGSGSLLAGSWETLGGSWVALGGSWAALGGSWEALGRLWVASGRPAWGWKYYPIP